MSYSSLPLPAEVTPIHGSLRGWAAEQNPYLANAAELRSLDLIRREGEGWAWGGVECSLSMESCARSFMVTFTGEPLIVTLCFKRLGLVLMSRHISAPEMGRGVLFYFQTNKRSPHTHVLVCLVLDCLV